MCFPLLVKVCARVASITRFEHHRSMKRVRALGREQIASTYPQYEHTM